MMKRPSLRRSARMTRRRPERRGVPVGLVPACLLAAALLAGGLVTTGAFASSQATYPLDPGVAGAPPVTSSDELDPSSFADEVEAAMEEGSAWVRDPLRVALRFVDQPSTGATTVVREDDEDGADGERGEATRVIVWLDGLRDDSVRAIWFEVRLERMADGAWHVVSGRQAFRCGRGDTTDELVAGLCP